MKLRQQVVLVGTPVSISPDLRRAVSPKYIQIHIRRASPGSSCKMAIFKKAIVSHPYSRRRTDSRKSHVLPVEAISSFSRLV